jgi:hypothetical protein
LSPAAVRGLVGDIVKTIGPESESDPAALTLGALTWFGSVVGPKPHFTVERTQHHLNLFTVFVGESAKSRKGTAGENVAAIFGDVDPEWARSQVQCGLSSGEGLIEAVATSTDKRVLFVEDEFSSVLRVMSRPRNTLSTTLRRAWDGKTLQIATRINPVSVQDGHIGLMGHTTVADLERFLNVTDIVNGFSNRALWTCTKRSKLLPFGGRVSKPDLASIVKEIKQAIKFASRVREIGFSERAARLWTEKYAQLSADRLGLVGAATSRAEAQTRRIAAIYALMDERDQVCIQHLRAALEVWRYCQQSAEFIFGRRRSTTIEDEIVELLRGAKKGGVSRTDISAAFSRHRNSYDISVALERLKNLGWAKSQKLKTDGRSAERWFLVEPKSQ